MHETSKSQDRPTTLHHLYKHQNLTINKPQYKRADVHQPLHTPNLTMNKSHYVRTGEQYFTTYEAAGPVSLAVVSAEDFHACTDRAIVNKTTTGAWVRGDTDASAAGGAGDADALVAT